MKARAHVQKQVSRSSEFAGFNLRPLCRAIAVVLAAGTASGAYAAGMVNLSNIGAHASGGVQAGSAGITNLGVGVSPQQALQASQPSIQNLAHAAQGIAQQIAAQQAAAAAATVSNVPNGLTPGGLQVAPGVSFDPQTHAPTAATANANTNPNLWINANAPQQSVNASGHVTVEVDQTGQDAVATWQTMNVGPQTTLYFNQSAGTQTNGANNWVILNRIVDPTGAPSQILGNVKAEGTVLVINRNGILFGAGSQINVHSLVASSLDVLNLNDDIVQTNTDVEASNNFFLQNGLAALEAGETQPQGVNNGSATEILGLGNNTSVSSSSQYQAPGNITIEPGASITTQATGTASDGGLVLIAAPNVTNGGSITATGGQVILAAGVGVSLTPNVTNPQVLLPELSGKITTGSGSSQTDITPAGTLTNTGIIQTARGNIDLLGSNINQDGVVGATTSVTVPGGITISTVDEYIANTPQIAITPTAVYPGQSVVSSTQNGGGLETNRAGELTFGNGSVTTIMADTDGETATSAPGTTFTPGSITMTAGSVWFQSGSLVEAPGSTVSVAALTPSAALDATPPGDTAVPGRIYLDSGATIDVSGLANVQLPISDILLDVGTINENNLADSPLLRDSFLNGLTGVVVDSTLSGTTSDGLQWVGSPILNLSGAVSLIPRTVDQLLTNGGTVTLAGAQVMTADGSSINLNGGYVHYLGGVVDTTRLVDANGAIVPIGQATDNDTYVGIAGEFVESHPRWGVTETWINPLLSGGTYEGDFIVGGNAGTLNVFASQAMVLDGDITAEAFGGSKQVQGDSQPVGGSFNLGAASAIPLTLGIDPSTSGESGTVILQDSAPQLGDLAPGFGAGTALDNAALNALGTSDPDDILANTVVPVSTLNNGGFANVSVNEDKQSGTGIIVVAGTQLTVQPGGSITLKNPALSGDITVLGDLAAPSGTITISSGGGNVVVGPDALLSVAGQWVNNDTQAVPDTAPGDSEFINGGSITLSTTAENSAGTASRGTDTTGSILLQSGSVIDVSSGGEIQSNGQILTQNGIPEGTGGSLSLLTYTGGAYGSGDGASDLPLNQPTAGRIAMDGTILSDGLSGGGTLTLQGLGFQIGGDPTQAPSWDLVLPTSFFSQQGFGKYVLNAMYDTTVAPGASVVLTQQNLIPDVPELEGLASGANLAASGFTTIGTLDPFHRQATDLVMTGGGYLAWLTPNATPPSYAGVTGAVTVGQGASIRADAGASIGLGSPAQVTVLGSIIAPGGSITLSADSTPDAPYAQSGQFLGNGFTSEGKSVWLGADAVLDVAGVALVNPLAVPVKDGLQTFIPDTGKVLAGGTVVISDDSGAVAAQAGSVINVSGTSATFDELQANGQYAPQQVWSDAGSITLGASSGLYFDGNLQAQPGAGQAQGGTLTLLAEQTSVSGAQQPGGGATVSSPSAQVLVLQQSGNLLPGGQTPGEAFPGAVDTSATTEQTSAGVLQFSVDRLTGSGIANLVVDGASRDNVAPVPVAFDGNVSLDLTGSVVFNTGQLVALNGTQVSELLPTLDPGTGKWQTAQQTLASLLKSEQTASNTQQTDSTVSITAPYVAIVGPTLTGTSSAMSPVEAAGNSTLDINASFIDLENQFQLNNFAQASLTSSGDIRLTSTNGVLNGTDALLPGELFTSGNLTFRASDLYPSTGSTFILDAAGPTDSATGDATPTTITFLSNGTSSVPLSAGGSLLVDATDIIQSGTVRAPSGSLIFGVGDPTDAATISEFNNLTTLVATDSVTLGNGSITSVSNDGAIIPFGTTVDGVEWQFNPVPNTNPAPDVTSPPSKFVSLNGSSVSLNQGATVDLSGGGDLQAEEWVPGTGGTRDLLSQFNVSFASNPSGTAVPVNIGGGNVYAILPGAQSPVAAYDPVFAQTTQPTNVNGTAGTATQSIGVGSAALNSAVGESVYLSGVPGLPAGYYTLLPAKYATLPGAYRVTVSSVSGAVAPGASQVLPDGTVAVAGYFGNTLTGSRSATPTLFDVQSGAVWQQYSQYTLTSANSFFPSLASSAGNVTPPLPMDAGQLVLAANKALTLGATLDTTAAPGGAPAEVDIASQDIQIVGTGEAALPGYLQLSTDQLDGLNAGSLLIGGTRTQTTSGITIDPIAGSVVVSNDAADPLTGPEVILVASNNVQVDSGSVIAAKGTYPAAKDGAITIGQVADSATGAPAISGDGALLSVSNGGASVVTRQDTSGTGILTVGAGATLTGGQALTLDSSGNLTFDPAASLSGNTIAVDGSAITFTSQTGAAAASLPGFVVGPQQLAQLAAAQDVILRSAGAMNFDGNVDVTFGKEVDLSAGSFSSDGGTVTINAPEVAITNEIGAPVSAGVSGAGTLTVNASEIDFGTGDRTVTGFGSVTMNATGGIVGQGEGTFDFGAVPVTLNAPVYLADTSSEQTIKTTGVLNLNSAGGTALTLAPVGGAISFIGGTVNDNGATIEAPAGNVSLEATTGNLNIAGGSLVSSAGVSKQFFDVTEYAPAGAITLTSDVGTINVESGATLDFSGTSGGGAAGSLALSAPDQTVSLAGTIKGSAASGFLGGSFSVNTGGAVDLDSLSTELATSGVNNAITVQTGAGNLVLSAGNTMTARSVSLTADGGAGNASDAANGNVIINGTIDANGVATTAGGEEGGTIDLYGRSSVDIEGKLLAEGSDAYVNGVPNANSSELGGTINVGTTGTPTAGSYNTQYGYENVSLADSGRITLGANAVINVSGGGILTLASDGKMGGAVNLRAPVLDDDTVNVVDNMNNPIGQVTGTPDLSLEAYAVWSTTDGTTGAQHFDGIVDPAGWYKAAGPNATPQLVDGTFTDQSGDPSITYTAGTYVAANGSTPAHWIPATLSNAPGATWAQIKTDLANDLENDFFTPAAISANASHETFYGYLTGTTTTTGTDGSTTVVTNNSSGTTTTVTASDGTVTTTTTAPVAGTLMGFVQSGVQGVANQFAGKNITVVPGIELDNPSSSINDGNISVVTNWNLGAGSAPGELAFRFLENGQAPIITLRAENNVQVDATLTDGFFQIANPVSPGSSASANVGPLQDYAAVSGLFNQVQGNYDTSVAYYLISTVFPGIVTAPILNLGAANSDEEYYAMYQAYVAFLASPVDASIAGNWKGGSTNVNLIADTWGEGQASLAAPTAPTSTQQAANPATYLLYLTQYQTYFDQAIGEGKVTPPTAPTAQAVTVVNSSTSASITVPITNPAVTDNTPSPVTTAANPLPLEFASLAAGNSSSFRMVAGADLNSANPLALQTASVFETPDGGSVTMDGHFGFVDSNNDTLVAPTMIRTGTGQIDIAAANNVEISDTTAPATIYTAGVPASPTTDGTEAIVQGNQTAGLPDILVTPAVNPDAGGNISIHAQNDITGIENVVDTTGAITGKPNSTISQFWWQWMEIGASPSVISNLSTGGTSDVQIAGTSIDFGAFDQGVMSVGGNVSVSAGGDVRDLAVSLPTTWYLNSSGAPVTVGAGNLSVAAGGNILSGDYFVANGTGTITAGGQIAPDLSSQGTPLSTILATQNGALNVTARQGVDIGGVFDPSYVQGSVLAYDSHADSQGYSAASTVSILSTTGDVDFGTAPASIIGAGNGDLSDMLPATLSLVAFSGGITVASGGELFPSPSGQLNLIANQTVVVSNQFGSTSTFGMSDADPAAMPSPTSPVGTTLIGAHDDNPLHAGDTTPARIYSLNGSIVDGVMEPDGSQDAGFYGALANVVVDKVAQIEAGEDIVNLAFQGQNLSDDDVTRIVAGQDIVDTPFGGGNVVPSLVLGGPGTFDVEAGRNIGPLTSVQQQFDQQGAAFLSVPTGIDAVGNANNPNLPHESASVDVLFGVAPGIDDASFIATYINPNGGGATGVPSTSGALVAFMQQYDEGLGVDTGLTVNKPSVNLTADQAWQQFQALPSYVQQLFVEQVFFSVLTDVGNDFHNQSSPFFQQYGRGYQAINTLFPSSLGYTANDLGGGTNGANSLVQTGNLDIRSTTIQTQQGGNVSILGPGGEALVGSSSAPPEIVGTNGLVVAGPGTQGILTLEQGDINIFTDQSLLLAQSRVFTEQGGNITIWSSNGDINAGQGSTTVADVPPPEYVCDPNHFCTLDAKGEVTGAGIGTLQTLPNTPTGNANLLAPRGTVDAGAAGIRVSGDLNVAALQVLNAANIQVQGKETGVPVVAAVDTGALTAASSAASAVTQMAQNIVRNNASGVSSRQWVITVEVEGFGDGDSSSNPEQKAKRRHE